MSDLSCPLPTPPSSSEEAVIRRLLAAQRIAVIGASDDPSRASHSVAAYLRDHGKEVIPVNPNHRTVLGLKCYPSLELVPGRVDLVDVFRRPEFCADIVRSAIATRAGGVWLQSGIVSPEARQLAEAAALDYIENRCLMVEMMQHA